MHVSGTHSCSVSLALDMMAASSSSHVDRTLELRGVGGGTSTGSLDRPAYRPSSPLLAVLDVPVLDLHYGGILALVEWPAIDRIFLAALLLLQDRRPMRPVFHRVQCH